jgi:hypothetical protein
MNNKKTQGVQVCAGGAGNAAISAAKATVCRIFGVGTINAIAEKVFLAATKLEDE